jgi:hypothetical protein
LLFNQTDGGHLRSVRGASARHGQANDGRERPCTIPNCR